MNLQAEQSYKRALAILEKTPNQNVSLGRTLE